jgi:predicted transposase YbfD/YdcC
MIKFPMERKIFIGNSVFSHFGGVTDPRSHINKKHNLIDILVISVCAVLCGCEYWEEIEDYAKSRESWFRKFLELPNGIPSHDRIRAVFVHLNPDEFENCFRKWVETLLKEVEAKIINIDGKTSRRTHDTAKGKAAIHMVSAWSSEHNLVLGQEKVDDKSNEITAIPELIDALDISGGIITIDAMGCQKNIVKKIVKNKADYIIGLKGNQKSLAEKASNLDFSSQITTTLKEEETIAHGRAEQREYFLHPVPGHFNEKYTWENFQSIGKVISERLINGNHTKETRFYITSLPHTEIQKFVKGTRGHWAIENCLHWQLDISYGDDQSRKRTGNAAQNFSLLQKITLNLLKREKTKKGGIIRKRRYAGFDEKYLEKVLSG